MMKKLMSLCLVLLLVLSGCSTPKEEKQLKVLAPKGAPSIALAAYYQENPDSVEFVDGADVISAALVSPTSEYDVIIAPINLGAVLIEKESTEYRLDAVVTWGNLYMVENTELKESDLPVAVFGEGAVPQKIFNTALQNVEFSQEIKYFNSVVDVQAQLLSSKASYGLVAEPALTAMMAKASEQGLELSVVYNLQEKWSEVTGQSNYPQAAVFVKEEVAKEYADELESLSEMMASVNVDNIATYLSGNEEVFGTPPVAVLSKAFDNMNIEYAKAKDKEAEILRFLELYNITSIEKLLID